MSKQPRPALQFVQCTAALQRDGRRERVSGVGGALTAEWAGLVICVPLLKAVSLQKQKNKGVEAKIHTELNHAENKN